MELDSSTGLPKLKECSCKSPASVLALFVCEAVWLSRLEDWSYALAEGHVQSMLQVSGFPIAGLKSPSQLPSLFLFELNALRRYHDCVQMLSSKQSPSWNCSAFHPDQ